MLDLQTFVIPDNIMIKGHTIVIDGGVLIDGYSGIEYGIIAEAIVAGEHVEISGEVSSHSVSQVSMMTSASLSIGAHDSLYSSCIQSPQFYY
jgi:predicted acyltransferase (DUF342 family)